MKAKATVRGKRRQFASDLVVMKHRAGQLGLWKTMHALDIATRKVGYEIADIEQGKQADLVG